MGMLEKAKKIVLKIPESNGKIKAMWIYGSATRGEMKEGSDIDVMVIADDVSAKLTASDMEELWKLMKKAESEAGKKGIVLHFQKPKTLTGWWDLLRSGEPWALTSMKDAVVVYDPSGFVEPIKRLLNAGRLSATQERAFELVARARAKKDSIKKAQLAIMSDMLLAMVESAQAVLMYMGKPPPSPEGISRELKKLAKKGMIDEKHAMFYSSFFKLAMKADRHVEPIPLGELEEEMEHAKEFLEAMESLFSRLEKDKHETIISESFEKALESVDRLLRKNKIDARSEKEKIRMLKRLADEGKISKNYLELLEFILETAKKFMKGEELPERDIYNSRLYARTLEDYAEVVRNA